MHGRRLLFAFFRLSGFPGREHISRRLGVDFEGKSWMVMRGYASTWVCMDVDMDIVIERAMHMDTHMQSRKGSDLNTPGFSLDAPFFLF